MLTAVCTCHNSFIVKLLLMLRSILFAALLASCLSVFAETETNVNRLFLHLEDSIIDHLSAKPEPYAFNLKLDVQGVDANYSQQTNQPAALIWQRKLMLLRDQLLNLFNTQKDQLQRIDVTLTFAQGFEQMDDDSRYLFRAMAYSLLSQSNISALLIDVSIQSTGALVSVDELTFTQTQPENELVLLIANHLLIILLLTMIASIVTIGLWRRRSQSASSQSKQKPVKRNPPTQPVNTSAQKLAAKVDEAYPPSTANLNGVAVSKTSKLNHANLADSDPSPHPVADKLANSANANNQHVDEPSPIIAPMVDHGSDKQNLPLQNPPLYDSASANPLPSLSEALVMQGQSSTNQQASQVQSSPVDTSLKDSVVSTENDTVSDHQGSAWVNSEWSDVEERSVSSNELENDLTVGQTVGQKIAELNRVITQKIIRGTLKSNNFLGRLDQLWQTQKNDAANEDKHFYLDKRCVLYRVVGKQVLTSSLTHINQQDLINIALATNEIDNNLNYKLDLYYAVVDDIEEVNQLESKGDPYQHPFGFLVSMQDDAVVSLLREMKQHIQAIALAQFEPARCQALCLGLFDERMLQQISLEIDYYSKIESHYFQDVASYLATAAIHLISPKVAVPLDPKSINQASQTILSIDSKRAFDDQMRQQKLFGNPQDDPLVSSAPNRLTSENNLPPDGGQNSKIMPHHRVNLVETKR